MDSYCAAPSSYAPASQLDVPQVKQDAEGQILIRGPTLFQESARLGLHLTGLCKVAIWA